MAATETQPAEGSNQRAILFIALNPEDTNSIREGLRDMSDKWRLEFVSNIRQGLTALGKEHFDAAVVDLQAPGIDAPGLFKTMMDDSPTTLRLGIIAPPERQAIQQVKAAVHQLLTKPCDPKVLKAVLARTFSSQEFLTDENFKRLASGIRSLPVLPQIYTELMTELKSEDPSLERAGQIVAKDMGLSAKILTLVNSAFFGLGRPITHPSDAAMFIGTETLRALVLSLQVFSQFSAVRLKEFSVENLWKHSWTTGVLAKRLCEFEEADRSVTDEAFIAGLLHDLGKLMLAANLPSQLEENIRQGRQKKLTLWEQEYQVFNASHAELGGYLLSTWGLSQGVVEAVAFHHRPTLARRQNFSALTAVHVANTVAKKGPSECGLNPQPVSMEYLRSLDLGDRVEGWKQFFNDAMEKRS
ncbi:MAG: HDOD domain-containing protein [Verrucomicrobia bacterium]|nr:HDOD domain-containing protein [Verrucomicrobiota bacterium]